MYKKLAYLAAVAAAMAFVFGGAGCYEDPNDPQTWIKKLNDPRERDTAATKLLDLKNAAAAKPLVDLYEQTKDPRYLDDALSFHSKDALPELVKILADWNPTDNEREAIAAAKSASQECITLPDASEVQALEGVLLKQTPPTGQQNLVKVNAIDALAKIKDRGAVDALIHVLSASTATQPILLNTHAAIALGELGDPKAVPALIQGLFVTGQEPNEQSFVMFPEAKMALVRIGAPAIPALLELMAEKNADVAKMAKDGDWEKSNPGVAVWKAEAVLGDMHAKEAVPSLLRALAGKSRGLVQEYALYALGRIADPSSLDAVAKFATDTTRPWQDRLHADEALVFYMDPRAAAPLLANIVKPVTPDAPDEGALNLQIDAMKDYARLVGPDADVAALKKIADAQDIPGPQSDEQQSIAQIAFAKSCGKDAACYEKALDDPSKPEQIDEALFQLARLGDAKAVPKILKVVPLRDPPTLRDASLFAIERLAGKDCTACKDVLDRVIQDESEKKGVKQLVEKTQITEAYLTGRL